MDVVVHNCNLRTQEAETGRSKVQNHRWIHNRFKANMGCVR